MVMINSMFWHRLDAHLISKREMLSLMLEQSEVIGIYNTPDTVV